MRYSPALAGRSALILIWWAFTLSGGLLSFPWCCCRALLELIRPTASLLALVVGVLAGLVQVLGLLWWVYLVPALARAHGDAEASDSTRDAVAVTFRAFHQYLGVGVGEHLGYLLTGVWTTPGRGCGAGRRRRRGVGRMGGSSDRRRPRRRVGRVPRPQRGTGLEACGTPIPLLHRLVQLLAHRARPRAHHLRPANDAPTTELEHRQHGLGPLKRARRECSPRRSKTLMIVRTSPLRSGRTPSISPLGRLAQRP